MREAIGSLSLTTIVIVFLVLFSGYMAVSINTNKAYKVRNEIITIIQKNNGVNEDTIDQIRDYMTKVGYRTHGICEKEDGEGYGATDSRNGSKGALFCIKTMAVEYETKNKTKPQFPTAAYYEVKVFFALDLPIINNIIRFDLRGTTKKLFYPVSFDS